ncbi:3-hydroxyacyl-CoA dehydrogenase NAD-binding domain-containing protein [Erythrobacter sp. EC-HK427]|uniref:3-hydroxyacyl-CoA dehydrogenase NAD-binding domain-containing protein n=1 Tax=Erythrobacter sp. EC-HK427 TaxID=2038396 RepID=UPI001257BD8D|nr:3-hydroxyacyl-CoA dehydrogenase NAD-binding domain-containing protein [Erythrobacter sp. EC-HK427]VVT10541.1 3-hydroxybutyryl-CoA dehydrogenase [Erythrobacter sp. EC-HK427]
MTASVAKRIGVCGAGAMGSGIAEVAAQRGADVKVFDVNADALKSSEAMIGKSIARLVEKGKLTSAQGDEALQRMQWIGDLAEMADRELVIEAVIEDADIKASLFGGLEDVLPDDAIIASNTSSLPIGRLARNLRNSARFCGMHFFNPATIMKLVEVVSGPATDPSVADTVAETARAWGKVAIPVADVPGFIVNRVARPFYGEAFTAFNEQVAQPHVIDALFRANGFRMGPLELTDLIGQDVNYSVARSIFDSYFGQTRFVPQLRQAALVDAGWLGRKTGQGVYSYSDRADASELNAKPRDPSGADRELAGKVLGLKAGTLLESDGVLLGLTRGKTAANEARTAGKPVVLFDLIDPDNDGPLGYAVSDDGPEHVAQAVAAGLRRSAVRLTDRPGLIVFRTLAQIANAAGDAVFEHVADEEGIDLAMRYGVNYPFGPFAFADRVGRESLIASLRNIADESGQPMYQPSQYWSVK